MPRRPEIGNVQLYPNRPLKKSDKNGYVLKFYCPLRRKRIRRSCGTRDRREARRILRECRERLLNGEYIASNGAITEEHAFGPGKKNSSEPDEPKTWQWCHDRYREHRTPRIRESSLDEALVRLGLAERIFEQNRKSQGLAEGLLVTEVMTLDMLEFLQDRLLAGEESRLDRRSPSTVNSQMGAVMAFVRFCFVRGWIPSVPPIEKLDIEEPMKGRPITPEEFERMLAAVPGVVGTESAPSWEFALNILWQSAFRVSDLMDFSWDDDRHIHPVWPKSRKAHPTIVIPSTQKNGRNQEVPMLPGLQELLESVPQQERSGWIADPQCINRSAQPVAEWFRPTDDDLKRLAERFSNASIARACNVMPKTVKNWLTRAGINREAEFRSSTGEIPDAEISALRKNAERRQSQTAQRSPRPAPEKVGRIISDIGKAADIVVQREDPRTGRRKKFASAHDLRRGCAQRLINAGVSAETLKVIMRHASFATTEKHYGAFRSAQSAARELVERLENAKLTPLVGGLMGGTEDAPELTTKEFLALTSLLNSL